MTFDLNQDEIDLAGKADLWVQGGRSTIRSTTRTFPGKYGFGALRCAIDNLNGDNVEFVSYPQGRQPRLLLLLRRLPPPDPRHDHRQEADHPGRPGHPDLPLHRQHLLRPQPRLLPRDGLLQPQGRAGQGGVDQLRSRRGAPQRCPLDLPGGVHPGLDPAVGEVREPDRVSKFEPPIGPPAEGGKVSVRLAGNDTVTCTYVNERARTGPLSLYKVTTGEVGGPFRFKVNVPDGEVLEYTTSTDTEDKPAVVVSVPSGPQGRYTVTETLPPPSAAGTWSVDRVECMPTQVEQSSDSDGGGGGRPAGDRPGDVHLLQPLHPRREDRPPQADPGRVRHDAGSRWSRPATRRPRGRPCRWRSSPGPSSVAETTQAGQTVTAIPVEGSLENIPLGDYVVTEILPPNIGGTLVLPVRHLRPSGASARRGLQRDHHPHR